jgi:hypothetical protein
MWSLLCWKFRLLAVFAVFSGLASSWRALCGVPCRLRCYGRRCVVIGYLQSVVLFSKFQLVRATVVLSLSFVSAYFSLLIYPVGLGFYALAMWWCMCWMFWIFAQCSAGLCFLKDAEPLVVMVAVARLFCRCETWFRYGGGVVDGWRVQYVLKRGILLSQWRSIVSNMELGATVFLSFSWLSFSVSR